MRPHVPSPANIRQPLRSGLPILDPGSNSGYWRWLMLSLPLRLNLQVGQRSEPSTSAAIRHGEQKLCPHPSVTGCTSNMRQIGQSVALVGVHSDEVFCWCTATEPAESSKAGLLGRSGYTHSISTRTVPPSSTCTAYCLCVSRNLTAVPYLPLRSSREMSPSIRTRLFRSNPEAPCPFVDDKSVDGSAALVSISLAAQGKPKATAATPDCTASHALQRSRPAEAKGLCVVIRRKTWHPLYNSK